MKQALAKGTLVLIKEDDDVIILDDKNTYYLKLYRQFKQNLLKYLQHFVFRYFHTSTSE